MKKKQSILLVNIEPPFGLKAEVLVMASPHRTSDVIQMVLMDDDEEILLTNYTNTDVPERKLPLNAESFQSIFADCHTVLIPDGMFLEESTVFHTERFWQHGAPALALSSASILVLALEGSLKSCLRINELLGTRWTVSFREACAVELCLQAKDKLGGHFLPDRLELPDLSAFVKSEDSTADGLYQACIGSYEDFCEGWHAQDAVFERLGIDVDESMDCFNIDASWTKHLEQYTNALVVAAHRRSNGSYVMWCGDTKSMVMVFCKLLNYGQGELRIPRGDEEEMDDELVMQGGKSTVNWGMVLSVLVVALAIVVAKVSGAY